MNADSPSSPNPSPEENILSSSTENVTVARPQSILSLLLQEENGCFCLRTMTSSYPVVCKRTYG